MFCNVTVTFYVSHADFKRFVTFCKRLSSDSVLQIRTELNFKLWQLGKGNITRPPAVSWRVSFRYAICVLLGLMID